MLYLCIIVGFIIGVITAMLAFSKQAETDPFLEGVTSVSNKKNNLDVVDFE